MSSAAEAYGARVRAVNEQRNRLSGTSYEDDIWIGARADRFRSDPHRKPEAVLQAIIDYLQPDDVVIDVGGGAGRFGLAVALHCRELIDVDPSAGMRQVFDSVAAEAGIKNARYVQSDWLQAEGIEGDVSLTANVTYFVADIVPFIEKLEAASRRLVILLLTAEAGPNGGGDLFQSVYGEELALVPGYRELLPVLWELNILPEVRVCEPRDSVSLRIFPSRQEAIGAAISTSSISAAPPERIVAALARDFDELFVPAEGGFRRRRLPDGRQVLITWRPERS
jgi:hypothetical protein